MAGEPLMEPRVLLAVALLAGVGAVSAARDRSRRGAASVKGAEYARLAALALAGAGFGAAADTLTAAYAPEYFTLGKGLSADGLFRLRVLAHGAQAGGVAGAVAGAILLFAANPRGTRAPVPARLLARWVALALAISALVGVALAASPAPGFPPADREALSRLLAPGAVTRFETVWRAHLGLYAGAALGLGLAVARARRHAGEPR